MQKQFTGQLQTGEERHCLIPSRTSRRDLILEEDTFLLHKISLGNIQNISNLKSWLYQAKRNDKRFHQPSVRLSITKFAREWKLINCVVWETLEHSASALFWKFVLKKNV